MWSLLKRLRGEKKWRNPSKQFSHVRTQKLLLPSWNWTGNNALARNRAQISFRNTRTKRNPRFSIFYCNKQVFFFVHEKNLIVDWNDKFLWIFAKLSQNLMWQKISYPTSFFWQKTEKSLLVCSLLLLCSLENDKIFKVCLQTFFHQPKNKDSYYKRIIVVEKAKLFFSVEPQEKKKTEKTGFCCIASFSKYTKLPSHTIRFYGKYRQFRSPTGTSQFLSISVKFWFYLT